MSGVLWAVVAGIGFGFFQSFNRRAARNLDPYWSTFILIFVSAAILSIVSIFTEDLSLLWTSSLSAFINFGLAGFIHFFLGWTLLSLSQKSVGASRTSALIGTIPLFGFVIGLVVYGEFLSLPIMLGIVLIVGGVYLVSNG